MNYSFSPDRTRLILRVDPEEQAQLRELPEDFSACEESIHSDHALHEFLEHLTCNSELDWIDPYETGDLTDAPMLGTRDEAGKPLGRWAWMHYETTSLLEQLRDKGVAVLIGGPL
jgi:hypothetical protein